MQCTQHLVIFGGKVVDEVCASGKMSEDMSGLVLSRPAKKRLDLQLGEPELHFLKVTLWKVSTMHEFPQRISRDRDAFGGPATAAGPTDKVVKSLLRLHHCRYADKLCARTRHAHRTMTLPTRIMRHALYQSSVNRALLIGHTWYVWNEGRRSCSPP